ncbi:MAG: radical SAM protein [Methanomassiliicoccales archaeon]|nr:MAG: radical SAM protein [Methanomassiliicoccales archaeon]
MLERDLTKSKVRSMFPIDPEYVQIEISSRCNLSCPLCPKGRNEVVRKSQDMDIEYFGSVVKEMERLDPRIKLWNYGDPLLHRQIISILGRVREGFTDCSICTNGNHMTDELAKAIVVSGITEIVFAIDGITQESYEKYRRGGKLDRVLNNLDTVIKAKDCHDSDIQITVQTVILKHTFDEIPKLGEFYYRRGVQKIKTKTAMLKVKRDDETLIRAAHEHLYMDYPGERYEIIDGNFKMRGKRISTCPVLENSFVITSDGTILPCCWDSESLYPIDTKDQWNNVRELVNSDSPPEMCMMCPIRYQQPFGWDWDKVPGVIYE